MAADNPDEVSFQCEPDTFTLEMNSAGKCSFKYKDQLITSDCPSASVNVETRDVKIMGRPAGKIASTADVAGISNTLQEWFPPGTRVHHVVDNADYQTKVKGENAGIVVVKFSAEWCGPCKRAKPMVDSMSQKYPDVTFLHVDGDENQQIYRDEGATCYPTFFFYKDGQKQTDQMVKGADMNKVEEIVKELGGVQANRNVSAGKVVIETDCDVVIVKKEANDKFSLKINGEQKLGPNDNLFVEVDRNNNSVSFRGNTLKLNTEGEQNVEEILTRLEEFFPTKVKHVHEADKFDEILKDNDRVIAKYSANWCGPCHAIAPFFVELSNQNENVVFLHIDVDEAKALSTREGIQAMPTFHFYHKGTKNAEVRGGNKAQLKVELQNLKQKE